MKPLLPPMTGHLTERDPTMRDPTMRDGAARTRRATGHRARAGRIAALALLACGAVVPPAPAQAQTLPPHAWLFGTWTGGLFPVAGNVSAQLCLAQPVVIFTKDVVLRATLTDLTYVQRLIETARTDPGSTDFKFVASAQQPVGGFLGVTAPAPVAGFGCENLDVLHVQRRGENEISFPGCAEFPNPLVRCPAR